MSEQFLGSVIGSAYCFKPPHLRGWEKAIAYSVKSDPRPREKHCVPTGFIFAIIYGLLYSMRFEVASKPLSVRVCGML